MPHVRSVRLARAVGAAFVAITAVTAGPGPAYAATPAAATEAAAVLDVSVAACAAVAVPGALFGYTLTYANTGTAPAADAVLTETIPAGTTLWYEDFGDVSADGTTVTFALGTLAPGDTGMREIWVSVLPATTGTLVNDVSLTAPDAASATTATVTPVSIAAATATGRATGVAVSAAGGGVAHAAPDTGVANPDAAYGVDAGVARAAAASVVRSAAVADGTSAATAVATAGAVAVDVGGISVRASAAVARAESSASVRGATSSSGGSLVSGLVVNGTPYGDVTSPQTITVTHPLTGAVLGTVRVLDHARTGAADGVPQPTAAGTASGLTVTALRVTAADLPSPLAGEAAEAAVATAATDVSFPAAPCGGVGPSPLRGEAALVTTGAAAQPGAVTSGRVVLPAGGEVAEQETADLTPLGAVAGRTRVEGTAKIRTARAFATVEDATLQGGAVVARALDVAIRAGSSSAAGTAEIGRLVVNGVSVCHLVGQSATCRPQPNTVVALGAGGTLVLNEQVTYAGGGFRTTAARLYLPQGGELALAVAYGSPGS